MSSAKSSSGTDDLSLVGGTEPADTTSSGAGWGSAKFPHVACMKWAVRHPSPFATLLEYVFSHI